jgi:hypothetical protein
MPIEFNVGEFGRRLSRALTTRGRMPLDLDERLVPVVMTEDASGAPFRQRGQQVMAPFLVNAGDHAGTTAGVLISAAQTIPSGIPTEALLIEELVVCRIAGTVNLDFGWAAPQVNPAPIFSGVLRNAESTPHGGPSPWAIAGDISISLVGAIPLGRILVASGSNTVRIPVNAVLYNRSDDPVPIFYLSLPDTTGVSGYVVARSFSLPLS